MKWLMNQVRRIIATRKDQLPKKGLKSDYPVIYWIEAPLHVNFNNNDVRKRYNEILEDLAGTMQNMRIMRMKKIWDPEDKHLFVNSSLIFTTEGIFRYWGSVDNALQFNDMMRNNAKGAKETTKWKGQQNKYKWRRPAVEPSERRDELRFKLPKPNSKKSLKF